VSERSITEFARAGTVVKVGRGRYDLVASVQRYTAHLREVAAARGGETAILDLTQERARLARVQGDGQELKNQVVRGELVAAADVEREWSGILREVRAGMLTVPGRVHQKIPHLDASEVALIDREVRDVLEALGNDSAYPPGGASGADPAAASAAFDVD